MPNIIERVTAVLVSKDPRGQADHVIDYLVRLNGAQAAGLFEVRDDRLVLFAGGIDLASLAALQRAWKVEGTRMRPGQVRSGRSERAWVLAPLHDEGRLAGVLFMVAPGPNWPDLDAASLKGFGTALVKAIAAVRGNVPGPAHFDDLDVPEEQANQERLRVLLDRYEWNIARVARALGLSRRTIYLRLKRYRIDRQRVPKSESAVTRQPVEGNRP